MKRVKTDKFTIKLFQYPCKLSVLLYDFGDDKVGGFTSHEKHDIYMHLNSCKISEMINEILVHELVHVKRLVEDLIETQFDEESEAYFISNLFTQIKMKLARRNRREYDEQSQEFHR